jgi:cold shock protein
MNSTGTVSMWRGEEGWGVIDSPDTPGGCWFHFSHLWHVDLPEGRALEVKGGYRDARVGESVEFDYEPADQDGYSFRADSVWPVDRWSPPRQFRMSR